MTENARGEDQRKLGEKLLPPSSKTLERPGEKWGELLKTMVSEGPWLQPYAPSGAKRISKQDFFYRRSIQSKNGHEHRTL